MLAAANAHFGTRFDSRDDVRHNGLYDALT